MEITLRAPDLVPPPSARPPGGTLTPDEVLALHEALLAYHRAFARHFRRAEQRHWALKDTEGQLLPLERKSIEPMADALGGGNVQAMQQFVGLGAWDDDAVLATHQRLVAETLGDLATGVLIVDGCDFPKQGSTRWGWRGSIAGRWARWPTARPASSPATPAHGATRWWTAACMSTRTGSPTPLPTGARAAACPPTALSRRARS